MERNDGGGVNAVAISPQEENDSLKCIFINSTETVDKIELHELNTIIKDSQKTVLTFDKLNIGEKFYFSDSKKMYVKINSDSAVQLSSGDLKYVFVGAVVTKVKDLKK